MKKYRRYNFCETLEKDIQQRTEFKDLDFKLEGKWKTFLRKQVGFNVYIVDGEWVRNNLSVIFGHGGHAFVHEFIPLNEIWVSSHHIKNNMYDCGCTHVTKTCKVTKKWINETVEHEIIEFNFMGLGNPYWKAHLIALKNEKVK
jgi:hypothetical protein